jgi:hypothetical protein
MNRLVSFFLVLPIFVIFVTISIFYYIGKNRELSEKNTSLRAYIEETEKDAKIALHLVNKEWYIVNKVEVSEKKNGEGEVIMLPEPLLSKGSRLAIINPERNKKIIFVPRESSLYKIGKFLTYQYENEDKILLGH